MEERINNLLLELAKEINEKILANEFEMIDRRGSETKVTIKIGNDDIEIWTYKGDCYAYAIGDIYLPKNVFVNPSKCRKLLLNPTVEERQKEINRINREIEKLELLRSKLWI